MSPTQHSDVLIVGAGPAGISAATAAARVGARVKVLDDNPSAGGQIWRSGLSARDHDTPGKAKALAAFYASGAELLSNLRVVDAPSPQLLRVFSEETGSVEHHTWDRLILATGARERLLPFPGWTLPGVMGAGGLQALVKGGFSVSGKRVVVAGTGPLLLAVAAHLQAEGAQIISIAEQATSKTLFGFAKTLWSHPSKLLQGTRYRMALLRTPYHLGCWPTAAEGTDRVTAVKLTDGAKVWTEPCDLLACGFHLVPNTELAQLLGCNLNGDYVAVDENQQTSLPNVYCTGEPTGIAGLDAALLQGAIAGLAASGQQPPQALRSRRDGERTFGHSLERAFALRPELRQLSAPDTIVCRCEDVRFADLAHHSSWTDAKLQTRCGMGPCQGRICGPAVQTLFGWRNASVRPPIFPIPLSALTGSPATDRNEMTAPEETL